MAGGHRNNREARCSPTQRHWVGRLWPFGETAIANLGSDRRTAEIEGQRTGQPCPAGPPSSPTSACPALSHPAPTSSTMLLTRELCLPCPCCDLIQCGRRRAQETPSPSTLRSGPSLKFPTYTSHRPWLFSLRQLQTASIRTFRGHDGSEWSRFFGLFVGNVLHFPFRVAGRDRARTLLVGGHNPGSAGTSPSRRMCRR